MGYLVARKTCVLVGNSPYKIRDLVTSDRTTIHKINSGGI